MENPIKMDDLRPLFLETPSCSGETSLLLHNDPLSVFAYSLKGKTIEERISYRIIPGSNPICFFLWACFDVFGDN